MQHKNDFDMIYVKPSPQEFAYFIDGEITEPSNYRELMQVLNSMAEGDSLELTINSHGGFLHSTTMISNAIRSTRGHVHGVLNGVAMSGASILYLSCHSVDVLPHSTFMAHTSSGAEYGKLSDTTRSIQSSVKQLEALYKDVYWGFYTEEEIDDILAGKDSYLEYDEICKRLDQREKLLIKQQEQTIAEQEADMDAMFDEMEPPLAPEIVDKLSKQDLRDYIKGMIEVKVDTDGSYEIIKTESFIE